VKPQLYWKAARIAAVFGIIELLSLVLWLKGEDFGPSAARYLRWVASCGFVAGAAYLAHKLIIGKNRKRKIGAVWAVWGLMCAMLFFTKSLQSKPHLKLILNTRDSPTESLELTNEFLLWKPSKDGTNANVINTADFRGRILIPASSGVPSLRFKVVNDSEIPADNWFIKVMISKKFEIAPSPGWEGQDVSVVDEKLTSLTYFSQVVMLPGCSEWTPPIDFKSPPLKQYAPVIATLRARDMPASMVCFSVAFWASTNLTQRGVIANRPLVGIRGASLLTNDQYEVHYPIELNRR